MATKQPWEETYDTGSASSGDAPWEDTYEKPAKTNIEVGEPKVVTPGPSNPRGHGTSAKAENLTSRANDAYRRGVPEDIVDHMLRAAYLDPTNDPQGLGPDQFANVPHQAPTSVMSRGPVQPAQVPDVNGNMRSEAEARRIAAGDAIDPTLNTPLDRIVNLVDTMLGTAKGTGEQIVGGMEQLASRHMIIDPLGERHLGMEQGQRIAAGGAEDVAAAPGLQTPVPYLSKGAQVAGEIAPYIPAVLAGPLAPGVMGVMGAGQSEASLPAKMPAAQKDEHDAIAGAFNALFALPPLRALSKEKTLQSLPQKLLDFAKGTAVAGGAGAALGAGKYAADQAVDQNPIDLQELLVQGVGMGGLNAVLHGAGAAANAAGEPMNNEAIYKFMKDNPHPEIWTQGAQALKARGVVLSRAEVNGLADAAALAPEARAKLHEVFGTQGAPAPGEPPIVAAPAQLTRDGTIKAGPPEAPVATQAKKRGKGSAPTELPAQPAAAEAGMPIPTAPEGVDDAAAAEMGDRLRNLAPKPPITVPQEAARVEAKSPQEGTATQVVEKGQGGAEIQGPAGEGRIPVPGAPVSAPDTGNTGLEAGGEAQVTRDSEAADHAINQQLGIETGGAHEVALRDDTPAGKANRQLKDVIHHVFGLDTKIIRFGKPVPLNGVTRIPGAPGKAFVNEAADDPFGVVATHELLHHIRKIDPDIYDELVTRLRTDAGMDLPSYRAALKRRTDVSGEGELPEHLAQEELLADTQQRLFTEPDFVKRLADEEPDLFKKLAKIVTDWINTVLSKLRDLGEDGRKYFKNAEEMRNAFADALKKSARRTAEQSVEEAPKKGIDMEPAVRTKRLREGPTSLTYRVKDGEAKIMLVRTPKEARGKGHARKAMTKFLAAADEKKLPVDLVLAEQDAETQPAKLHSFYSSLGFKQTGTTKDGSPIMRREPAGNPAASLKEFISQVRNDFATNRSKLLADVRRHVSEAISVELTGSYENGNPTEESDVDMKVVVPDGTNLEAVADSLSGKIHGVGGVFDIIPVHEHGDFASRKMIAGNMLNKRRRFHRQRLDAEIAANPSTRDLEEPTPFSRKAPKDSYGEDKGTDLVGLPTAITVPGRGVVAFHGYKLAQDISQKYAEKNGATLPTQYVKVDVDRAKKIAQAYEDMKHDPSDPAVKKAYATLIDETSKQYQDILKTGLHIEFIDGPDPYAASPRLAILDVLENNHLWVFPTEDGFGSSDTDVSDNPLLAPTKFTISGKPTVANDIFRVVHDYFGHIANGVGFRADGEENAWREHAAMYSPEARRAMTTETRGQNSWVNYGEHGEKNRTASSADTVFADQKTGLLPEWVSTDGATDPASAMAIAEKPKIEAEQDSKYTDFISSAMRRRVMDDKGQDILDDMIENNESPADVSKQFWNDTYWRMPGEVQRRFQKMLTEHTGGMTPGSVISVDMDGNEVVALDWQHIAADGTDLPREAEYLEGTDRGFVVLMHEANERFANKKLYASRKIPEFHAKPIQKDAVAVDAVHYSNDDDLEEIDPSYAGTGRIGAAQRRRFGQGRYGKNGGTSARAYFFVRDGSELPGTEGVVVGAHPYQVRLTNLYNQDTDPRGFAKEHGGNVDAMEEEISNAGFDGLYSSHIGDGSKGAVAIVFDIGKKKIPVERWLGTAASRKKTDDQTDTPAFKKWFGDSEVRKPFSDKPMVVYHGSTSGAIDAFEGDNAYAGWFGEEPKTADSYANSENRYGSESEPTVYPAYLRVENPLYLSFDMNSGAKRALEIFIELGGDEDIFQPGNPSVAWNIVNSDEFAAVAKAAGYDGVRIAEKGALTWGVFDQNQIKSATGNSGAFDPSNPSIVASLKQPPRNPGESQAEWQARVASSNAGAMRNALNSIYDMLGVPKTEEEYNTREIGRQGLVEMFAKLERAYSKAESAVHAFKVHFDKRTEAQRLESIDEWENDKPVTDPVARRFFAHIDQVYDSRIQLIQQLQPGAMEELIRNYFPHIWEKPSKASGMYRGKKPLAGDKSFLKKRSWPTMKEGMDSGLKPVSTNPAELAMAKLAQMDKFIGLLQYRDALAARGWIHKQPAGDTIPPGWARVDDSAFKSQRSFIVQDNDMSVQEDIPDKAVTQHWVHLVPEPIARDINNYLSRGLKDVPGFKQIRFVQNLIMAGRLGWSGFHAGFTTLDNFVTHAEEAARRIGSGDIVGGLVNLVSAPLSVVASPYRGGQLVKRFLGKPLRNGSDVDPHTAALLDLLERGGARAYMDASEWNGGLAKELANIRQHKAWDTLKGAIPAIADASGWLIHRKLVPAQKMSARVLLLKFELDRFAYKLIDQQGAIQRGDYNRIIEAMHPDAAAQIARKVVTLVDERLGHMAYDNLFWNMTIKHAAQLAVGAPGWQVGTVNTVTGAVRDLPRLVAPEKIIGPLDKAGTINDATFGRITSRMSNLVMLALVSSFAAATIQYLLTGEGVDDPKDLFFPKTGRKNKDGTDERISLPSYWKEHYALTHHSIDTAMHKIHPLWGMAHEIYTNQDFFGTHIRDEESPVSDQVADVIKYIGKGFLPYVATNAKKVADTSPGAGRQAANFFGVSPAPPSETRSKFEQFVTDKIADAAGKGGRSQKQYESSQAVKDAESAIRNGEKPDLSEFSEKEKKTVAHDAQMEVMALRFSKIPFVDRLRAWKLASTRERARYKLADLVLHHAKWTKNLAAMDSEELRFAVPILNDMAAEMTPTDRAAILTALNKYDPEKRADIEWHPGDQGELPPISP